MKRKPAEAPAHFQRWSTQELEELRRLRAERMSRAQLAEHFRRTPRAIKHKLHQVAGGAQ